MGLVNISSMLPIGGHSYPSLARNVLPTSVFSQRGNSSNLEGVALNKALTTISKKDVPAPGMLWTLTHPESWSETTKAIVYGIFMAMQIGQEGIEFSQRLGQPPIFGNRADVNREAIAKMVVIGGLSALPQAIGEHVDCFDDDVVEVVPIPESIMSAQADVVNIKAVFTGKVQRVGFRMTTKYWADELKLAGTVRNLPDGTVEAYIRGPKEKIDWLFTVLQENEFPGHVTNLDTEAADLPDTITKFRVVR